jgi:hypothetical protein
MNRIPIERSPFFRDSEFLIATIVIDAQAEHPQKAEASRASASVSDVLTLVESEGRRQCEVPPTFAWNYSNSAWSFAMNRGRSEQARREMPLRPSVYRKDLQQSEVELRVRDGE